MRHNDPAVQKLNDLLRIELGNSPTGEPLYQWRHTGDLVEVFALHDSAGRPVKEMFTTPGGVLAWRTKTIRQLQNPKYRNHWAICYWEPPVPIEKWSEMYGTTEDYPAGGTYFVGRTINREGVPPSRMTTQQFIEACRKVRQKTLAQRVEASLEEDKKAEQSAETMIEDYLTDRVPAFANLTPGKRGGSVSFGGTERTPNADQLSPAI